MAPKLGLIDDLFLITGISSILFNRFLGHTSVDFQAKVMGIDQGDPVKIKSQSSLIAVVAGVLFLAFAVSRIWGPDAADSLPLTPGPDLQDIAAGIGALIASVSLLVQRKSAVDLTAAQASEILKFEVSKQAVNYLVLLFHGIFFILGAIMITEGIIGH